jgi:hypothetical protein
MAEHIWSLSEPASVDVLKYLYDFSHAIEKKSKFLDTHIIKQTWCLYMLNSDSQIVCNLMRGG